MSVSGGLHRAVDRAELVGATALQLFVKSSRQWSASRPTPEEVRLFRRRLEKSGLRRYTLAHASYLINLASPDAAVRERSVAALVDELGRCAELRVPYLVVHPGSHVGAGEEAGLRRVVRALDRLFAAPDRCHGGVMLLLETTAGQGSNLGHRFEQLAWILERARRSSRLGVCFDTCHALAAGYEFDKRQTFNRTFGEFDRLIGLDRLKAFHLNDSKHDAGSRRDRHEHIGSGRVGLESFRLILNDRRIRDLPMVLETPKGEDLAEDRGNLATLRSLIPRSRR
jgi:deoxyribonuclease-4